MAITRLARVFMASFRVSYEYSSSIFEGAIRDTYIENVFSVLDCLGSKGSNGKFLTFKVSFLYLHGQKKWKKLEFPH